MVASFRLVNSALVAGLTLIVFFVSTSIGLAAKLAEGQDPREFYPASAFLDATEMREILSPGTVWCMDPQGDSCLFISVITEGDEVQFKYDVIEKWDENTVLSVPVSGTLNGDGTLCEVTTADFSEISVTTEGGKKVKAGYADEIRAELVSLWQDDIGVEYCYFYAVTDPRDPNLITQFVREDGVLLDIRFSFFTDDAAGAASYYSLRD